MGDTKRIKCIENVGKLYIDKAFNLARRIFPRSFVITARRRRVILLFHRTKRNHSIRIRVEAKTDFFDFEKAVAKIIMHIYKLLISLTEKHDAKILYGPMKISVIVNYWNKTTSISFQ